MNLDEALAAGGVVSSSPSSSSDQTGMPQKWPGLLSPFLKAFLVKAPEYGVGAPIAGLHEYTPGKLGDFFQNLGERISNVPSEALRQEVAETSSIPWFENDGDPWYSPLSWSPTRLPQIASKAMSIFGENVPLMLQTAGTSWVGRKVLGGAMGAAAGLATPIPGDELALTAAGAFASDLVFPSVMMGLGESRNFAKQAREIGVDEDIAARNARIYGPASGFIETLQSYAAFGARAAGRSGKLIDPKAQKALRFTLSKYLSASGIIIPEAVQEGAEEVSQDYLSNQLMLRSVAQMKERHGAGWAPSQEVKQYTLADAAESAAGGVLIAGMMMGVGHTQRLMTGRVDAETEEQAHSLAGKMLNGMPAAVYQSTADENVQAIAEAVKADTGKKGGVVETFTKVDLDAKKIASMVESGNLAGARDEWAKQAGIKLVLPDGTMADEIMKMIEIAEHFTVIRDDAAGKNLIVAFPDLISNTDTARRLSGVAVVTEDYEKRQKWAVDLSLADLDNDKALASAFDINYSLDGKGVPQFSADAKTHLNDLRTGLKALSESDLFAKNNGKVRVNFAQMLWMTPAQLKETGNEAVLAQSQGKARADGRILMRMGGSNRMEEGSPVLEIFPRMGEHHLVEETIELALKSGHDSVARLSAVQNSWLDRVSPLIEDQAIAAQGTRRTIASAVNPKEMQSILSSQVEELINVLDHEALPADIDAKTEMRYLKGLKARLATSDNMSVDEAGQLEREIRAKQNQFQRLTFADQMKDLHAWLIRAKDPSRGDRREIFAKTYALQQAGFAKQATPNERHLIEYLHFTPAEAKEINESLKSILGEKTVDWLSANRVSARARAIPLAPVTAPVNPTSFTLQDEAKVPVKSETDKKIDTLIEQNAALASQVSKLVETLSGRPVSQPTADASSATQVPPPAGAGVPPIPEAQPQEAVQPPAQPVIPVEPGTSTPPAPEAPVEARKPLTDASSQEDFEAEFAVHFAEQKRQTETSTNSDDDTHSGQVVTTLAEELVNDKKSTGEESATDEGGAKAQVVAGNASEKFEIEAQRYNPILMPMRAVVGSQARTEFIMLKATKDAEFVKAMNPDDPINATDPQAGLKAYLTPKEGDRYEQKSFKGLVSAWLKSGTKESKEKGIELLRSLQRFYSVYEPVPNGYYALGKAGWSGLSDDQFRPMNRFNRTEEFTKSIQARLASVFNSPADLQRIREQLAALPDYAEQDRPGLSKVLADLYGIPAAMLDSISLNATWKGLGLGLRKVRTVFKSSMINEQGWQDVVDMMLKEPVTGGRSNLRNIILASSEEEGLSLHGHDQSNKNIVTAMVSSPALRALNAMLKPGERVDQLVRYIRGVRNTDNTGIEWDEMDDYQRLCVELAESLQGPAGHGFYRVVPLGDKTDGFFMRYKRWTGDEGIAEYARLYKALPARAKELFQTPEELTAAAAQAPTVLRPNAKPDQIDAGLFQSMTVSAAIANLDMYQKLYGNLDMYGFNQDKIMKRGSQIPSGGATYPKKIKALFVKGIGGKLKLGDGAIFHSGAFAAEFKRQMGSEYNPDVIKPYIRGLNFGVKCASYNIDMLKDVDAEAYRSLVALFKANPDVTHIIDETSVKFSEGLTWADAFKSDMKLNPEANLNAAKLEIEAGSMFLVQNIDKSAEAVKGLLSRQMIFATSHLPRAGMREKIAMDIIDALYRQFQDTKLALDAEGKPVNGTLAEKVLADALKGDRNESLRKALLENKERQDSLLNNSAVVSSIFSLMRKMMEPKVNTHSGVQVPAFDLNLPGFEKDGSGRNHLPWNRSNLKVKAGKEWIAPRAAQSFIEKGDALAELREHWEKYLDLAVIDSEGKPVLDEKGKPTFRNEIVRKHAKKFWIPGTVDWSARIPSDSLLSAAPYRWMGPIQAGSDAGLAMITEAGRKANGADFDADSLFNATYFVDEQGNPYFTTAEDASDERKIRAMMNRRLNLLVADYQETDLNYLISESADGKKNKDTDIEDLKDMLKALAKGYKAKASYKMNSRSFAEQAMNVFAAGTRMLGIAAKGNSAFDVESTNGVYWEQEIDLGNGLKLSLPKEEADRLMSPAGFKDRMYRKNVIGRAMVNFLVDDPSDPHAGYLFTYDTLPLALAAMQGVKLTPANVAAELTKIVEFLKSSIIAGPNGYIEVLQAQRFTGERGPGLFNDMLVKTYGKEQATELLKLIAVSRSRMVIGRISDFAVAGKRPNDIARLDAFTEDIDNIEANRLYGVAVSPKGFLWAANQVNPEKKNTLTKVYNVGELAKSQTFAMSKKYVESIKAQAETGMTRAVEDTVKEVLAGEYVDLRVRKDVREAIQRASAVKAIAPAGFDASGAPAAFQTLSSAYPQGHAARAFLDRLIANKQEIQLVPSWRTGDFKAKDMEAAQAGWDALSPEHQTLLAAYQFNKYGIGDSMWRGGYMPLIGWKWRAATTQALSDPSLLMGSDIQAYAARMIPHADPQTGEKGWIPKSVREQFFVPTVEAGVEPATVVEPVATGTTPTSHSMALSTESILLASQNTAKDLERILKSRFALKVPPMPDEWTNYMGSKVFKNPDGTWTLDGSFGKRILSDKDTFEMWVVQNNESMSSDLAEVAKTIEQWKQEHGIKYDPNDAYSRGEGIYHDVGAFNSDGKNLFSNIAKVLLKQERKLRAGDRDYWRDTENQLVVSAYTTPSKLGWAVHGKLTGATDWGTGGTTVERIFETETEALAYAKEQDRTDPLPQSRMDAADGLQRPLRTVQEQPRGVRPGSGLRLVIRPSSEDLVWAAVGDVYSGTVRKEVPQRLVPLKFEYNGHTYETHVPGLKTTEDGKPIPSYRWDEISTLAGYGRKEITRVEPKAPAANKLPLLANSLAAAIEGRRPTNYNELGVRLRLGNFYVEEEQKATPPTTNRYEARQESEDSWNVWDTVANNWMSFGTMKTSEQDARETALNYNGRQESSIPKELQRLNKLLQQAFVRVHGSLDPVATYEPKTIKRVGGEQTFSLTWANAVDRVAFSLPAYNRKAYNRTWKPIVARIEREAKTKADIERFIRVFDIEEHLAKNLRDLSTDYPEAPERDPLFDQARTRDLLQQSVPLMQAGLQSLQFNESDQDRIIKATLDQFRKHPARGIEAMQEILGKSPLVAELRRLTATDSHSLVISPMARNFNDIDASMYFKSPIDGDLRAEIPFRFTFKENADFEAGNPVPIRDVIELQDPDIEKSYPELLDMEVMKRSFETPLYGQYVPEFKSDAPHIELNSAYSPRMMQATLTHEIQHAIQDIEGRLTPSGNIAKTQGYEAYLNVPSEVEARYAERRMDMDQGQIESNLRGEVPELSYSMTPVVDNLSTIQQVSSGKYGMHKAYYTAQEEIQASSVETAFHVDKWRKVIPKKDAATWELITRWIDDEPAYRDRFNALDPKAQAVAREVKQFFVAKRDEFNDTLSGFSTHEWMSYRDNFINRIYAKKAGSAQTKARPIETKHTTRRVFDTLKEAEADGYVLAEKDAAELAMIYAGEVKRSAQTRLMLAQGFAVRDQLDNAHLIPVFAGEPNIRPSMKTLAKSSAQEAADTMSAENGEEYKGSSSWNAIKTALEKITGRYDPAKRGYIRMESPFAEYESFWVHPDSLGVVKSMLNDRWGSQIMKQVERVNAWSKFMTLGFSLFHTIAIWENVVSTLQGDAFKMKNGRLRFAWKNDEQFTKLMEDPTFVGNWIRHGLTTTPYPNIDMGVISQDLTKIKAWAEQRNNKAVGAMVKSMIKYKEFTDKHLWQNFNSMSKVYAAWKFYNMRTEQLQQQGKTWNEDDLKTQIAQGINVTFGDLAWHRFIWATPKVKQFLRLTVFAPDWTLSNIEIARAGIANIPGLGAVLGKGLSNETRRLAITRAWPGMLIFMLGWPNVVQAMIYAAFGGSPDDDDRIFAAQNEKGKEFSVDVTPAFRKFGWTSKDNPKERFYMRFAKQSWEVVEAVENPLQTMKGKSSALVKIAMEQVTGENMIGWDTPFKKETFWGGMLYSHERGFMGSRAGTIVEKFMPMAVVSYLGGKPPSWLAPVGKGMTQSSAEREISKVLTAYADPGVWEKITGTPDYEAKLDALVPEVIEAAQRNGVNVKEAVKRATSNVLGKHYDAFWKALNRNDAQGLEDAAASIVRVHGSLRTVYQSMGAKGKRINRPLDPQRRSIVQQFMLDAQRKPTRQEEHAWFMDQIRNPVTDDEE